jgi:hypothetical protein
MKNAAKEVAYFLNNRPLCFLSTVFAVRDFILGLALFLTLHDIQSGHLYKNLQELGGARTYGMVFMVIAVFTAVTAIANKTRYTKFGLQVQAWFWLFAGITYVINGNYILALIFGAMCSIPSGYLAFYYKYTPIWDEPKKQWRLKHGLEPIK